MNELLCENHFNRGLTSSVKEHGLDSLQLLILDFGPPFKDLVYRRNAEIDFINTWPGSVYNIKDVYKRPRSRVRFS